MQCNRDLSVSNPFAFDLSPPDSPVRPVKQEITLDSVFFFFCSSWDIGVQLLRQSHLLGYRRVGCPSSLAYLALPGSTRRSTSARSNLIFPLSPPCLPFHEFAAACAPRSSTDGMPTHSASRQHAPACASSDHLSSPCTALCAERAAQ